MSTDRSSYVNALASSITPAGTPLSAITLKFSAESFGTILPGSFTKNEPLPEEDIQFLTDTLVASFFAYASSFGVPSDRLTPEETIQSVFSGSSLVIYYQILSFMSDLLPSYADTLVHTMVESMNSGADYSKALIEMVNHAQSIVDITSVADFEETFLPQSQRLVSLKQSVGVITNTVTEIVQAAQKVTLSDTESQQVFLEKIEEIKQTSSQFSNVLSVLIQKLKERYIPAFSEPNFRIFSELSKEICELSLNIAIISVLSSIFDKDKISIVIRVLVHFANAVFNVSSKSSSLFRFRGDYEESKTLVEQGYQTINTILQPLLQALVDSLPHAPSAFEIPAGNKLVELFTSLQGKLAQFNIKFDNAIGTLKNDRRFSIFRKGRLSSSNLSALVLPTIKSAYSLSKGMLTSSIGINEVFAAITDLSSQFDKLQESFDVPNVVTDLMTELATSLGAYTRNPDDIVSRYLAGQIASEISRELASLEASEETSKALSDLRVLQNQFVTIYTPSILKNLMEALSVEMTDIPQEIVEEVTNQIKSVYVAFADNPNPRVRVSVVKCLLATDALCGSLDALCVFPSVPNTLRQYANLTRAVVSSFRETLQTLYLACTSRFAVLMKHFIDDLGTVAALQTDERYLKFVNTRSRLESALESLSEVCATRPQLGHYSYEYLLSVIRHTKEAFLHTADPILCSKDLLKTAAAPAGMKEEMIEISSVLTLITELQPYIIEAGRVTIPKYAHLTLIYRLSLLTEYTERGNVVRAAKIIYDAVEISRDMPELSEALSKTANEFAETGSTKNIETVMTQIKSIDIKGTSEKKPLSLVDRNGKRIPGLEIDSLPDFKEIDAIFTNAFKSQNELVRRVICPPTGKLRTLIIQFMSLFEQFLSDSSPEKLSELNAIGRDITSTLKLVAQINDISLDQATMNTLRALLPAFEKASDQQKLEAGVTFIVVAMGAALECNMNEAAAALVPCLESLSIETVDRAITIAKVIIEGLARVMFDVIASLRTETTNTKLLERLRICETISGGDVKSEKLVEAIQSGDTTELGAILDDIEKSYAIVHSPLTNLADLISERPSKLSQITDLISQSRYEELESLVKSTEPETPKSAIVSAVIAYSECPQDSESQRAALMRMIEREMEILTSKGADPSNIQALRSLLNTTTDKSRLVEAAVKATIVSHVTSAPEKISMIPVTFDIEEPSTERPAKDIGDDLQSGISSIKSMTMSLASMIGNLRADMDELINLVVSLHNQLRNVSSVSSELVNAMWSPAQRSEAKGVRDSLVSLISIITDAAKSRLEGSVEVPEALSLAVETLDQVDTSVARIVEASVTSLAAKGEEKDLVEAAMSVNDSLQKFEAAVCQTSHSEDRAIIESASTIFDNAADLIEIAIAQTRWCLKMYPDITNKTGLVNTAKELVETLELLSVAATSMSQNSEQGLSKMIAACNLVSGAVARFTAEVMQKKGNPDLDLRMKQITDAILKSSKESKEKAETAMDTMKDANAKPVVIKNSFIQKLNAQQKLNDAMARLQRTEADLKKERVKGTRDVGNRMKIFEAEAAVIEAKKDVRQAEKELEQISKK